MYWNEQKIYHTKINYPIFWLTSFLFTTFIPLDDVIT